MRIGRAMTAIAAALVGAGLLTGPARAATTPTPTQAVAATIGQGSAITVTGTGWVDAAGAKGSIIGLKLDDGAVSRSFDLTWPAAATATDAFKANATIWGVVQAGASGAFSVTLPYPAKGNSASDLTGWRAGTTHSVRLLSGSLLTGDVVRTQKVSFTIGSTTAAATTLTAAGVRQAYGSAAKLAVAVSPSATGAVSARVGAKTATATLSGGKATLTLPAKALAIGAHRLLVSYGGSASAQPTSSAVTVTVVRAAPKVTVKAAKASVRRGAVATFTVTATAAGLTPSGAVTVKVAGASGTARLGKGRATVKVKIPASSSTGRKSVAASYAGDTYVAKGSAKPIAVTVTK